MASIILKVKPEDLKNKSKEIQKNIDTIKLEFDEIGTVIRGTKKYWEGEASNQHVQSFEKMKDDIETIVKRLKEHPKDLETMAGVYEEAERGAEQIAAALPIDLFD